MNRGDEDNRLGSDGDPYLQHGVARTDSHTSTSILQFFSFYLHHFPSTTPIGLGQSFGDREGDSVLLGDHDGKIFTISIERQRQR